MCGKHLDDSMQWSFSSVVVFTIIGASIVGAAGLLGFAYMTAYTPPGT